MTTKRTNGPCSTECAAFRAAQTSSPVPLPGHLAGCPSLYPAQQEPDALTRLARWIRAHCPSTCDEAMALISEAREEQRKATVRAKNEALAQAAKTARAAAEHGCNPYASCVCDWEAKLDGVEDDINALKDPES